MTGLWASLVCIVPVLLNYLLGNLRVLHVEPKLIADSVVVVAAMVAIFAANGVFDWFPVSFITSPAGVLLALPILALLPVLAGLVEGGLTHQRAYSLKASHWLKEHLKNNLHGALAGVGVILYLYSVRDDAVPYIMATPWNPFMEAILALSALAAVWFASLQQRVEASELAAAGGGAGPQALKRSTLRNLHQVLNVVWLAVIISVGARGGMYILSFLAYRRNAGTPLTFSWLVIPLLVAMLLYFFGCASSPEKAEIYITFLTGTPVAILVEYVWLSLYQGGADYGVVRWAFPALALLAYAYGVGVTFKRVKAGSVSLFSMVPTVVCIIVFWITILVN